MSPSPAVHKALSHVSSAPSSSEPLPPVQYVRLHETLASHFLEGGGIQGFGDDANFLQLSGVLFQGWLPNTFPAIPTESG